MACTGQHEEEGVRRVKVSSGRPIIMLVAPVSARITNTDATYNIPGY